ncbi:MAG TPA: DUF6152 family protein [Caulobacteraceae bacterium]|nr:DUF6152 family protein [Caulobacteraceae bacterium]
MIPRTRVCAAGLAAALLASAPATAFAHHSLAMYDIQHTLDLSGTVKQVRWTNPHIQFVLVVKTADGAATEWSIEAPSPLTLARRDWKRGALKVGDKADFEVHQARDGSSTASLVSASVHGHLIGKPPEA